MSKASHFSTLGPFIVGKTSAQIESGELKLFWSGVEEKHPGLSDAIGVYVLLVGLGKTMQPIYVGKAERGFRARLEPAHHAFRKARGDYADESLSLLLLARVTPGRISFIRKRTEGEALKSIKDLEILLIREFLSKGFKLINNKEKQFFQALMVPGYLHDEKAAVTSGSKCLRRLMRARPPKQ